MKQFLGLNYHIIKETNDLDFLNYGCAFVLNFYTGNLTKALIENNGSGVLFWNGNGSQLILTASLRLHHSRVCRREGPPPASLNCLHVRTDDIFFHFFLF